MWIWWKTHNFVESNWKPVLKPLGLMWWGNDLQRKDDSEGAVIRSVLFRRNLTGVQDECKSDFYVNWKSCFGDEKEVWSVIYIYIFFFTYVSDQVFLSLMFHQWFNFQCNVLIRKKIYIWPVYSAFELNFTEYLPYIYICGKKAAVGERGKQHLFKHNNSIVWILAQLFLRYLF